MHYGRGSSAARPRRAGARALAGRLRYFGKHHGRRAVLAVRALTVLGMSLRLLGAAPVLRRSCGPQAVVRRSTLRVVLGTAAAQAYVRVEIAQWLITSVC